MPENIFEPYGRQEVQFAFDPDNRWMPDLYADPVLGTTMSPPEIGFWGITLDDKQVVSQDAAPGNLFTWVLEKVSEPFLPGDQRFVTTGASMRLHEALEGQTLSGWDWITHKISPVQDAKNVHARLEFEDLNWDGEQYAMAWGQNPGNEAVRASVLNNTGMDLVPMLRDSRNVEHAMFLQRYHLKQAQAMEAIRQFDRDAGFALKWSSRFASGAANYLLTDPTFAPSFFIPIGGTQLQAARIGVRAARVFREGARRAGTSILLTGGERVAPAVARGMEVSRKVGAGVRTLGESPAAMHRGLATLLSHRGAVATEMAMAGGLSSHAYQAERIQHSEVLTDVEAYQDVYHWDETGLGVGIGATAGYIFGGRLSHAVGRRDALRAGNAILAGGDTAAPIYHSFDNVGAQGLLDNLAVRGKRAAQQLTGDDYDTVAPFVLDDDLLLEIGLDRAHMVKILEDLADAADGPLNVNAVHRVLADEITQAAKARRAAEWAGDSIGNLFEKEARANALARAVRESPKASDARHFRRAEELMEEELEAALQRHIDRRTRAKRRRGRKPRAEGQPSGPPEGFIEVWHGGDLEGKSARQPRNGRSILHVGTEAAAKKAGGEGATLYKAHVPKPKNPAQMTDSGRAHTPHSMAEDIFGPDDARDLGIGLTAGQAKSMVKAATGRSADEGAETLVAILKKMGHDGIVYKNVNEDAGSLSYALFGVDDFIASAGELRKAANALAKPGKKLPPFTPSQVKFWQQEAADLMEVASRRDLLPHELSYLARVEAKLTDMGEEELVDKLVRARIEAWKGGRGVAQFVSGKASKTGRLLRKIRQEEELVASLPKGKERTNAMSRLRRARKSLAATAEGEAPVATPQEIRAKMAEAKRRAALVDATDTTARAKALDEVIDSLDSGAATLWEDTREVSKFWKTVGLGGLARKLARAGTGIEASWRTANTALRWLTQEMDHAKLLVDDLDPTSNVTHDTVQRVVERMYERTSEFTDAYRRLSQAGKFGRYIKSPKSYRAKMEDFNRRLIRHITGSEASDDADIKALAAVWRRHAEEIRALADEAGIKLNVENFFPRRWNAARIDRDRAGFRRALASHFRSKWEQSDEVHLGTLERLGYAAREVTDEGGYGGHRLISAKGGDLDGQVVRTLKRSDLEKLGLTDDDYLKGFDAKDADGWTSFEQSANRAIENLTGEQYEELPNGAIRIKAGGPKGPQSEQTRRLEETVWGNSDLEPYLDWRFLENVDSYMRTTGARVTNTARHSKRWGMKGLTMNMTIDHVEGRVIRALRATNATTEEIDKARAGFKNLRQKLHFAEGRLPSMEDHLEGWRNYLSDLWVNTAGALYGQGIGTTILFTEIAHSFTSRIYGPSDVPRKMIHAWRAAKGAFGRPDEATRLMMQTVGLTQRQFRLHTMQRLLGQQTYNQGFQFGFWHKALEPWRDVFDTLAGNNNAFGMARRLGEMPRAIARAGASNMMQLGGLEFFSTFARLMHVQSAYDEFARFSKAGRQMTDLLSDGANQRVLKAADEAAFNAAIAAKRTEEQARRLGARARFKVWKGLARQAGFTNGPFDEAAHWQVAEKWWRHGLLRPGIMQVLEETGAIAKRGPFKTLDYEALTRAVGKTPEQEALLQEARDAVYGLLHETIRKRVSEQSVMQTPTTQFARTPLGKVTNSMTTWTRSFHDNNIMDTAQMPLRVGASMLGALVAGESLNMVMRELWKGKDIEDVIEEFEADPDNWAARAFTSVPWLGQFGGWTRPLADALTSNERIHKLDLGESAAEGAASAVADVVVDTIHAAASDDPVSSRTWRTAARFLPGYRSWAGLVVSEGLEPFTGRDLINDLAPGRQRKPQDFLGSVPDVPILDATHELKPDLPEDVSFLYPEK